MNRQLCYDNVYLTAQRTADRCKLILGGQQYAKVSEVDHCRALYTNSYGDQLIKQRLAECDGAYAYLEDADDEEIYFLIWVMIYNKWF